MANDRSFLGTGWSFPPSFQLATTNVQMSSEEVDIRESLIILLSTRPGERVMNPAYGCNLDDLLFAPLTLTLKSFVSDLIETAILYFEPRINLESIDIEQNRDLEGELLIKIDYVVRSTNARTNLVYPFYRGEGTDL